MIPLIGGEALASEEAFGTPLEAIFTYSPFKPNESHLLNYYRKNKDRDVPYRVLDEKTALDNFEKTGHFDVISSVCPCAGLSAFSVTMGADNPMNEWMVKSAEHVLANMKPRLYWGENAPALITHTGEPVLKRLTDIAAREGYSTSLYRTKSLLHGVPQVRNRVFYFFWKGDKVPIFSWFDRPYEKIEDVITGVKTNFQTEAINPKTPSQEPFYKYVLEVVYGGVSHKKFSEELMGELPVRDNDAKSIIEFKGHSYVDVSKWMAKNGFAKESEKCLRIHDKLAKGLNIMRRDTIVPKGKIGAFIGHYPRMLAHPFVDRYINYREAMTIMGLPSDYELLNPEKSANHICQNVPYRTAFDMGLEIKAAFAGDREWRETNILKQYNTNRTIDDGKNGSVGRTGSETSLEAFF